MTNHERALRYIDGDGIAHAVAVRQTGDGHWQVVDAGVGEELVVDTLLGFDDGCPQAEAVARDYVATIRTGLTAPRRRSGAAIPEEGEADAHGHPRSRITALQPQPRRAAVQGAAR
jgi:hypothetical protein